jgi:hypothetical protein
METCQGILEHLLEPQEFEINFVHVGMKQTTFVGTEDAVE